MGSTTVFIGGLPAARVGDLVSHASCVAPIPSPTGDLLRLADRDHRRLGRLKSTRFAEVSAGLPDLPRRRPRTTTAHLQQYLLGHERPCPRGNPALPGPALPARTPWAIDGVPILVPDLRSWAGFQLDAVLRRRDLGAGLQTLLGDAAGPDSGYERDRFSLSTYAASHWAH